MFPPRIYKAPGLVQIRNGNLSTVRRELGPVMGFVNGENRIATLNFIIRIERAPLNETTVISETDLPLIEEAAELAQHVGEIKGYMEMSEAYAVGTINGVPVPPTNPAYENNSKYIAENFMGMVTDSQYTAISNLLS